MKLAGLKSVEKAHDESIWAATWVPAIDSHPALLLTGSLDETVRLWRPDELAAAAPPSRGHVPSIVPAAAHPSGSLAATAASLDSSVRVFDVDSNASVASLDPLPPSEVWGLQFDPKHGGGGSGGTGAGGARGFVGLLAEVLPQRGGRRHLSGDREGHHGRHGRLSRRAPRRRTRIEEESHTLGEVLRIKGVLSAGREQSDGVLFESLRRLQLMELSVQTLQVRPSSTNTQKQHEKAFKLYGLSMSRWMMEMFMRCTSHL